ncbi:MAG: hypothetical protein PW792_11665 [Acidobacteriaceae bacterium]|nr:hypothetical protein [Acidobacteriaceae bacterium]
MNFNNGTTELPVGKLPSQHEDVLDNEETKIDSVAMEGAKKAQERLHKNENTNSSNTIFSK